MIVRNINIYISNINLCGFHFFLLTMGIGEIDPEVAKDIFLFPFVVTLIMYETFIFPLHFMQL